MTGSKVNRRNLLRIGGSVALCSSAYGFAAISAPRTLKFGLTPVFLASDLDLLASLKEYLQVSTGEPVELVTRRTYQEITALLISGWLDAAWICGYPYVAHQQELILLAVPVWRERPLYQSYVISNADRAVTDFEQLGGDIHAFSDPDSNSGYLVTSSLLAETSRRPEDFFDRTFFTYSHRNVVHAVAAGLAGSGSVDGYVWEVMLETEPSLTTQTKIIRKSEWLGFPPIATARDHRNSAAAAKLRSAFLDLSATPAGSKVLSLLRLDRFEPAEPGLYASIAAKAEQLRRLG